MPRWDSQYTGPQMEESFAWRHQHTNKTALDSVTKVQPPFKADYVGTNTYDLGVIPDVLIQVMVLDGTTGFFLVRDSDISMSGSQITINDPPPGAGKTLKVVFTA